MALKFPTNVYAKLLGASWLDAQSKISAFCRVRFDSVITANSQFIFRYRLGTTGDQISIRKDVTTNKLKLSMTAGGALVTKESVSALVAGTIYAIGISWEKNNANGLKLFIAGAEEGSGGSTTSQTGDLNAGSGDLFIAARPATPAAEFGICTIETFGLWTGHNLTLAQHLLLSGGAWPHQIGSLPRPALFLPCFQQLLTRIPDLSGNGRSIESSGIVGTILDGAQLGQWMDPDSWSSGGSQEGSGGGAPAPNPWTLDQEVTKPTAAATVAGLTNGTVYEFYVSALDNDGNESSPSSTVEATPAAPAAPPVATPIGWRRKRRFSKYRSSQQ